MTASLLETLRADLAEFDGNAVSFLSETAARYRSEPEFISACIALVGDDDPLIQRGASWIWRDHIKTSKALTEEELNLLLPALGKIKDWGAALHTLQAFDHYSGEALNADVFARFFAAYQNHKRPFLRAWAVNALCRLASHHPDFATVAKNALTAALEDPAASVRARARNISF